MESNSLLIMKCDETVPHFETASFQRSVIGYGGRSTPQKVALTCLNCWPSLWTACWWRSLRTEVLA